MNAINKYKIRFDISKKLGSLTLYRIEALRDFWQIKKGDLGGWIEKEDNLSQRGNCWVYKEAAVFQNAHVTGNAIVSGHAKVFGHAMVTDNVIVCCHAQIFGCAILQNDVSVYDKAKIHGNAKISNNAQIYNNVDVYDNAYVYGNAFIFDKVKIYDNVKLHGYVEIYGNINICGNAEIKSITDFYVGNNTWSSGRYFVYTRSNKMWKVGCFYGTSEELIEKAYKDSDLSGRNYERVVKYVDEMYKDIESSKP